MFFLEKQANIFIATIHIHIFPLSTVRFFNRISGIFPYILYSIYSWSKCLNFPCFDLLFNQSELEFIPSVKYSAAVSLNIKKILAS